MSIRSSLAILITIVSASLTIGCDDHGHSHDEKAAATQPTTSPADGHSHGPNGEHN